MNEDGRAFERGLDSALQAAYKQNDALLGVLKELTYYDIDADNVYWKHNRHGVGEWLFSLLKPLHCQKQKGVV